MGGGGGERKHPYCGFESVVYLRCSPVFANLVSKNSRGIKDMFEEGRHIF